jgi:mitochondrial import receptor subunit TOM40
MQPGSYDSLHKEVKNVILSNLVFEGGKADLAKGLSPNFQVAHSFSLGTAGAPSLYHFGAVYVQGKHLLHGMLDSQGAFQGKYHYTLSDRLMCKFQAHVC